jgi:hypothetical protein
MGVEMKYQLLAGAAMLALSAFPAYATDIITFDGFSSSAGQGNSGTDTQGSPWVWNKTSLGYSAWGVPGLGEGEAVFNTTTGYKAEDFSVSFVHFGTSIIDETPSPGPGGYNEYTRFTSYVGGVLYAWTPVYDGTKNVTFTAPSAAAWLSNGDTFFVNIVFDEKTLSGSNTGFTAAFSAIPEVSTWAMMLAGFGALGFVGIGRNKKARATGA